MSRYTLHVGDCRDVMRGLPDASVDALVTDPPAGIAFMGKAWDSDHGGRDQWIAWLRERLAECLRLLKPGGHALVWAIPRTSHWTATAVEDAGFEVRDVVTHLFGTGFPKSLDVSKAIDAAAGAKRESAGPKVYAGGHVQNHGGGMQGYHDWTGVGVHEATVPATPEAAQWSGWGTALKPAAEFWVLARKPLGSTVAACVLEHGTGGLNIDGCRIGTSKDVPASAPKDRENIAKGAERGRTMGTPGFDPNVGRWPANVTLDEEAAAALDLQAGDRQSGQRQAGEYGGLGYGGWGDVPMPAIPASGGGPSRFFFTAKASRADREWGVRAAPQPQDPSRTEGDPGGDNPRNRGARARANHHPTVKPTDLMRWLCRLVTPPGGLILDPFMGSGSTGCAAMLEGFRFIGIEREPDYAEIARQRIERHAAEGVQESLFSEGAA